MNFRKLTSLNGNTKVVVLCSLIVLFLVLFFFYRRAAVKNDPVVKEFSSVKFRTLSTDELKKIIPAKIDSVVALFGVKKEWIKEDGTVADQDKQKSKKDKTKKPVPPQMPNLWFFREISIPKDVPAVEINYEISNSLYELDFDCAGNEDPKNGNLLLNIYNKKDSSKKTMAAVQFVYTDKVKRDAADVCLILDRVEDISQGNLEDVLKSPEKFSVVLPDIVDKIDAQTIVLDSKRDYLLFMNIGTDEDLTAEFKSDMREKEWKSKVRSVCYEYDKAAGVIVLNPKKIFPLGSDILTEFGLYNLKAYRDTVLIKFNTEETGRKKIDALFNDINVRTQKGGRSMIYLVTLTAEEFGDYKEEIFKLKRKGFKFFTFTEIIRRRLKNPETEIKQEITG
ncbi:MAG TPA: hypothetical protein VN514_10805 [Ignavibacteria bacterium]|nr:hypothetical protein [Ignavibacteria bacterium]